MRKYPGQAKEITVQNERTTKKQWQQGKHKQKQKQFKINN